MLKPIAEGRLGRPVGKNWVSEFIDRHQAVLTGIYLKGFDKNRLIAESIDNLIRFFENVSDFRLNRIVLIRISSF
jgi:hypothetical protein